jgi:AraC-like DNA-binding protein
VGPRFRKFFYTYISFSLLTIAMALVAYVLSYVVIRDAALESGRNELEFSKQVVEARIDDLYNTVAHLAAGANLRAVSRLSYPVEYPAYYDVIRFQRLLPRFNITDTFIEDVYVYFFQPRVLVSTTQAVIRLPFFYEHFLVHNDMTFEEWDQWLRSSIFRRALLPRAEIHSEIRSESRVLFFQSFPMDTIRPLGVIMVHIPERRFISYLGGIEIGQDGFVCVLDRSNRVVAAEGEPKAIERFLSRPGDSVGPSPAGANSGRPNADGRYTVLETYSERYDLRFVAAIPTSLFYERVNVVRLVFLSIIGAELLVGVALAGYFARRDMKPIQELLNSIARSASGESGEDQDEYELIARSFTLMVRDNAQLRLTIDQQAPLLRSTFIEQLLSGKFADERDLQSAQEAVGIEFARPSFAVCVASVRERVVGGDLGRRFSNQPVVQALLDERWRDAVAWDSFSYNMEPGTTAFVINVPRLSPPSFQSALRAAVNEMVASFVGIRRVRVSVACSDTSESPLDLRSLYSQARSIHDYQLIMDLDGVMFNSEIGERRCDRALFDLDEETTLARHVMAGSVEKTSALLDELYQGVQKADDLSEHAVVLFLEQLESAILRISSELVFDEEPVQKLVRSGIAEARSHVGFHRRFESLKDIFLKLCEIVNRHKQTRNERVLAEMEAYLQAHHSDPQLSLNVLSDAFHLSPGYVSRYFKEHAGIGMAEYIENLRIAHATELLTDAGIPIGEIAGRVGYTNSNTFYKAFRRIKGVSAGTYRDQLLRADRSAAHVPSAAEKHFPA